MRSATTSAAAGPTVGLGLGALAGMQPLVLPGGQLLLVLACALVGTVLARRGWQPRRVGPVAAVLVVVQLIVAVAAGAGWASSASWIAGAAVTVLALLVPVLVVTAARRRREYADAGWQLAEAEDRLRATAVERAVAEERATMAAEIHDALGHRITLIAVQAGRLSLAPGLDGEVRDGLRAIRSAAADAAAELGDTVDLLGRRGSSRSATIDGLTIDDLLEGARSAGLAVASDTDEDLPGHLSSDARAGLLRVVREGLTNAARHARVPEVRVAAHVRADDVIVRIANPTGHDPVDGPGGLDGPAVREHGAGRGLDGLRYRVGLLGGSVTTSTDGGVFVLEARLPADARRRTSDGADTVPAGVEGRRRAIDRRRNEADRAALWVPVGVLAAALAVAAAVFVAVTVVSVLPAAEADRIRIGQSTAEAQRILPAVGMLEAPRDALPTPPGAECRYHEVSVSFFARDDVHRICFAGGRVVAVDTVPAP